MLSSIQGIVLHAPKSCDSRQYVVYTLVFFTSDTISAVQKFSDVYASYSYRGYRVSAEDRSMYKTKYTSCLDHYKMRIVLYYSDIVND